MEFDDTCLRSKFLDPKNRFQALHFGQTQVEQYHINTLGEAAGSQIADVELNKLLDFEAALLSYARGQYAELAAEIDKSGRW